MAADAPCCLPCRVPRRAVCRGPRGVVAPAISTTRICARASVRLPARSDRIFQYLAASVNSAATSCPLGNRPKRAFCQQRIGQSSKQPGSGATARAVTTSAGFEVPVHKVFDAHGMNDGWRPGDPHGLAQKRGLLADALDEMDFGARSCPRARRRRRCREIRAPDPRSTQISACGADRRSCSESAIWRVQTSGSVERAIRLVCACHCSSSATKASRRSDVSRETGRQGRERASRSACEVGAASLRAHGRRRGRPAAHAAPRSALATLAAGHAPPAASAPPASCRRCGLPGRWSRGCGP